MRKFKCTLMSFISPVITFGNVYLTLVLNIQLGDKTQKSTKLD